MTQIWWLTLGWLEIAVAGIERQSLVERDQISPVLAVRFLHGIDQFGLEPLDLELACANGCGELFDFAFEGENGLDTGQIQSGFGELSDPAKSVQISI